jgi:peptidoglycan/LPS O-acetylase OafA/YrhL
MLMKPRVPEVDLLRFLSAISVMIFHYTFSGFHGGVQTQMPYAWLDPISRYGYLGVECFFMISGFVIFMSAKNVTISAFATARFARIFPALWICCTITFVCMLFASDAHSGLHASVSDYLKNLLLLNKLFSSAFIDGSYWSLCYEIQFYFFVAIFVLLRRMDLYPKFLVFWLCISIAELIFPRGRLASVIMSDYSAYFIGGSLAYLIWSTGLTRHLAGLYAASWIVATCQCLRRLDHMSIVHGNAQFSPAIIMVIVAAFFLIMLGVALKNKTSHESKIVLILGGITYPLYLLHQAIGLVIFNNFYPGVSPHFLVWVTSIGMVGLAYLVHMRFEKPLSKVVKAKLNLGFSKLQGG